MGSGKKDFNGIKEVLTAGPYLPHDAKDKIYLIPVNPDLVNPCDKNGMTEKKPIESGNRYSNDSKKKFSIGELELLPVKWGLKKSNFIYT